jgi:hypothetical protein
MANMVINGRTYEHCFVRGAVVGANKQLETKVSGGGGGGSTYRGTGYTAPVAIKSTTTTHDLIHVQDEQGGEHAIRLQNWDLAVRESHTLTAVWLVKKGRKGGPYVAIHNHSLNQTDYDDALLAKLHRSLWILLASIAFLVVAPLGFGLKLLITLGGIAYWWYRGIKGRRALIASGQLLRLAGV